MGGGASNAGVKKLSNTTDRSTLEGFLATVTAESNLKIAEKLSSVFDVNNNDNNNSDGNHVNNSLSLSEDNMQVSLYGTDPLESYRIICKLGDGAFSIVYKAVGQKNDKKFVAIKTCDVNMLAPSQIEDLKLEICILSRCKHPSIVELNEVYALPSKVHLVMEYLEGGELLNAICRKQRYAEDDARIVMYQVASALDYLHSKKIIHRDIKPENLILAKKNVDTSVKLVDFGFAIVHDDTNCKLKMNYKCGTYGYMAPEVMESNEYSTACDVWSFGVVCYVIQCGHMPFPSRNQNKTPIPYEFPKQTWKNISDSSKDLICHLLQTDPTKRFNFEDILKHEWFNFNNQLSSYDNLTENLESIRKYHALRKFRMSVLVVMVAKKLLKSINRSDEDMMARMSNLVNERYFFHDELYAEESSGGHLVETLKDESVKSKIMGDLNKATSTINEVENESLTPNISANDLVKFDTSINETKTDKTSDIATDKINDAMTDTTNDSNGTYD